MSLRRFDPMGMAVKLIFLAAITLLVVFVIDFLSQKPYRVHGLVVNHEFQPAYTDRYTGTCSSDGKSYSCSKTDYHPERRILHLRVDDGRDVQYDVTPNVFWNSVDGEYISIGCYQGLTQTVYCQLAGFVE